MTAQGVDFLENWLAKNVGKDTKPSNVRALTVRCLIEAAENGIGPLDMNSDWGSLEKVLHDTILHLKVPRKPGD